jgi:MFS family permease
MTARNDDGRLWTVFLAVLIDLLGFGIVLPLLPYYASTFQASPLAIGLLYSIYSFAQLVFSPVWGGLSDRVGRRPVMLASTFGASLAYVLFAFAPDMRILFLSRLLAGIMGGNISTAQAYVADVTTHEDRARGMGLIGAAFGIGFVMGPALAAMLVHPRVAQFFSWPGANRYALPGFFAALLSLASFLLVCFKLPETVSRTEKGAGSLMKPSVFTKTFWQGLAEKQARPGSFFGWMMASLFLLTFAQSSLYSAFPLFSNLELGLTAHQVGVMFSVMGLVAIVIQGGLIRILVKRFGEAKLFLAGCVLMTASFALMTLVRSQGTLMLLLALMAVGGSLNVPTLNSLISKEAAQEQMGAIMGSSQGIAALGRVVGPAWGGALFHAAHRLPFIATAAVLCLTSWVGVRLVRAAGAGAKRNE